MREFKAMDGDQTDGGFVAAGLAQIPPALQAFVDAGDLSGFVTLIWRKGEIAQVNTIGLRDIASGAPMTRDTLFRIASMTKPVTSVAALMLLEEGRLRLDDPITKWLPEFSGMQVLKDPAGPIEETYPSARDITVEDLITHRAGLAYAFTSRWAPSPRPTRTPMAGLAARHAADAGRGLAEGPRGPCPSPIRRGERFHYSHATEVPGASSGGPRRRCKPLGPGCSSDRISGPSAAWPTTDFWASAREARPAGQPLPDEPRHRASSWRTSPFRTWTSPSRP